MIRFAATGALAMAAALCAVHPAVAQQALQDNVVVVLDASGSMTGNMRGTNMTKMDAAKRALKEVLLKVPENTNVGLLVFSHANRRQISDWPYPLGKVDKAKLEAAIDAPRPANTTPLGEYLKIGADRLLKQRQEQRGYGTYRLLVVTDGEATDPHLVNRYLPDVLSRGITVDVIGVDMAQDHILATKVHSYRRANDPQSLTTAVSDVFAEVGDPGDDAAAAEDYELIAALPDELCTAALQALATSGNHPIGEKPPGADAVVAQAGGEAGSEATGGPLPGWEEPDQPSPPVFYGPAILGVICMIVAAVVLGIVFMMVVVFRTTTRRHRS